MTPNTQSHLTKALGCLIMCVFVVGGAEGQKPVKSSPPLTADELAIYKAVLQQYQGAKDTGPLNISNRTYPFEPGSHPGGPSPECMQGIEFENLSTVSRSFHELTSEVLVGKNMRLADPDKQGRIVRGNDPDRTMPAGKSVSEAVQDAFSTGLFSLSEIVFDKERAHAAVSYRFWCGFLCGNGATVVFEKVGNTWKKLDRQCGGWIS